MCQFILMIDGCWEWTIFPMLKPVHDLIRLIMSYKSSERLAT